MSDQLDPDTIFRDVLDEYGIATAMQVRAAVKLHNAGLLSERDAQARIDEAMRFAAKDDGLDPYSERITPWERADMLRLPTSTPVYAPSLDEVL